MNRIHRTVWNERLQAWVAVAESAKVRGPRALGAAGIMAVLPALVMAQTAPSPTALPSGGNVVAGSAVFAPHGAVLDVRQTSARAAIDWQTFNVGRAATVNFLQPSSSSVTLNRVLDSNPSQIFGRIAAPGQVFLTNSAGLYFAPGASVDVGGLVASTRPIGVDDFMAGNYVFDGTSTGRIVNQGSLSAGRGGSVALIAAQIVNDGTIDAPGGQVLLGAGNRVTLDLGRAVALQVEQGALDAQIEQGGAIRAERGVVYLTARALDALLGSVIRHTGVTEASGLAERGGRIVLEADHIAVQGTSRLAATGAAGGGEVHVGGEWQGGGAMRQATTVTMERGAVIDVSATGDGDGGTAVLWSDVNDAASQTRVHGEVLATGGPEGGDGGRIETSGRWLDVAGSIGGASAPWGAAGLWLLDPYNVTITDAGANGSFSTSGGTDTWTPGGSGSAILNTDIESRLAAGTSVTITTGTAGGELGDVTIDAPITKASGDADVAFTVNAANTIVVNQAIRNTGGTGKLHVVLDADNDNGTGDGVGMVLLNADIDTGGGNLGFGTGRSATINGISTLVGGDVYVAGSGARMLATGGGHVDVRGEMIVANTSGLSIDSGNGNVHFHGLLNSGNSYASVSYLGNWDAARSHAQSGTGADVGDAYLATITSRLENAVAGRTVNYNESWLGGGRVVGIYTNAVWRWVTGPEGLLDGGYGLPFFTQTGSDSVNGAGGTAISGRYSNWSSTEPNNYLAANLAVENESALQFVGNEGRWNDLPRAGKTLSWYVKETNLATSPVTVNAGTGTVTFSGAVGSSKALALLNVSAGGGIAIDGGAVTTEGAQTYHDNVTLGSASTVLTQTNTNTDFILQTGRSITNATGGDASLTIKTTANIIFDNGSSIASSGGRLTTLLWSNTNAAGGGIWVKDGAFINSNGGDITLSGGADYLTGYAKGTSTITRAPFGPQNLTNGTRAGILLEGDLDSSGGNVVLRGELEAIAAHESIDSAGVYVTQTGSIHADAGDVTLSGHIDIDMQSGLAGRAVRLGDGVTSTAKGEIVTSTGDIVLYGDSGQSAGGGGAGILLDSARLQTGSGQITLTGIRKTNGGETDLLIHAGTLNGNTTANVVASGSGDITLNADTLALYGNSSFASAGKLTVQPRTAGTTIGIGSGTGTLQLSASHFDTNFVDGFSGITIGSSIAGNISIAGATPYRDNLTLKTAGDIVMDAGSSLTGQSGQSASLAMWADSDASGGGAIVLNTGTNISTNGGHLWLGGGLDSGTTWNGLTVGGGHATGGPTLATIDGIHIDGAELNSAGGHIALYGRSAAAGGNAAGIRINDDASGAAITLIDGGTGTILLDGIGQGHEYVAGIEFNTNNTAASITITTASDAPDAITLKADARPAGVAGWGLLSYYDTTISATGDGGLSITGAIGNAGGKAIGFHSPGKTGTRVLARSGPIVLNAITNGAGDSLYAVGNDMAVGQLAGSAVPSSSSDITLNLDRSMAGSEAGVPDLAFHSGGTLTVQPLTAATSIGIAAGAGTLALPAALFSTNFVDGFAGITVGKSDAGAISVGGTTTFKDSTTLLSNSSIAIGGAVTANENLALAGNGTITQSQALAVTGTTTITAGAHDVTLANATNDFTGQVSVVSARNLAVTDSNAMTLGAVNATGTVDVATLAGDLTLAGAISTSNTGASALTLNAGRNAAAGTATGGNIVVGGGSVGVGAGGRATLYSGSVSGSTGLTALIGTGSGNFRYDSDESASNFTLALGSGRYAIYREQPAIQVAPAPVAISYGDTLPAHAANYSGLANGDSSAGISGTASWTTAPGTTSTSGHRIVGSYDVSYSGGLASSLGYGFVDNTDSTGELTITAKALALAGIAVADKVYDGSTTATISDAGTLSGVMTGDAVTAGNSGANFADKNVGSAKTVTLNGVALAGADAGNYSIAATAAATAGITPRPLILTGFDAADKVYDGTTTAIIVDPGTLSGVVTGDAVSTINGGASFIDKNVGSAKSVTLNGIALAGADAGNYSIAATAATTASITTRPLDVVYTGVDRVYDGGTSASVTTADDRVGGDTFTVERSASFADKNVGTNKPVSVTGVSLSGLDAGNYSVAASGSATASITTRPLDVVYTGVDRVYDGGTSATVTTADDRVGGDTFTIDRSASFADKNVDTGKAVSVTGVSLSGLDAGNYSVAASGSATASITARPLDVVYSGVDRVYDGGTSATVTTADDRVSGDIFTIERSASFADKNVGTNKPVSVTDVSLSGLDAGNYSVATSGSTTAGITSRLLALIGFDVQDKVYDGTTAATITDAGTLSGVVTGDAVNAINGGASFIDKNVGSGKSVTLNGVALAGADAGNYSIAATAATTASITARPLDVVYSGVDRVYDGGTSASVTTADDRVGGDTFTIDRSASFADKNVGTGKPVSVTGVSLSGTDAGNYSVAASGSATASITTRPLDVVYSGVDRVYDGGTSATVTTADDRVGGDTFTIDRSASFADKNAGANKPVSVTGVSLSGLDAGNYSVTTGGSAAASITPRPLALTGFDVQDKVYDGTATAIITDAGTLSGVVTDDVVSAINGGASFIDKNVGSGKSVTLNGVVLAGADAGNYSIAATAATTAAITAKDLTITANDATKTYDGTAWSGGNGVTYSGFAGGETSAVLSGTLSYGGSSQDAVNVGIYTITPGGLSSDNYVIDFVDGTLSVVLLEFVPPPPAPPSLALPQPESAPPALGGDVDLGGGMVATGGVDVLMAPVEAGGTFGGGSSGSGVIVRLVRGWSTQENGIVSVGVPRERVAAGEGFHFALPAAARPDGEVSGRAAATLADGAPLPEWLHFNAQARTFSARTIPPGALPIEVRVSSADGSVFIVVVSEREE